jgi:hypothetical protein
MYVYMYINIYIYKGGPLASYHTAGTLDYSVLPASDGSLLLHNVHGTYLYGNMYVYIYRSIYTYIYIY